MATRSRARANSAHPLDHVRMTEGERRAAQAALEQGERIAEFLVAAAGAVASIVHGIERGFRALARHPGR